MPLSKNNAFHFIVTRPNNRVTHLADQLEQLNQNHSDYSIQITHLPLICIDDYYDNDFFKECSVTTETKFETFDNILFISGNAIDQAKKQLTETDWKNLLNHPLYAIGEQTAQLLKNEIAALSLKSQVHSPKQMNSEGLLAMPELANLSNTTWLIIKGIGGRKKLKQGLIDTGAKVLELDVYQRKLPDLIAQKQIASYTNPKHKSPRPIWLITSLEALTNLWRINQNRALNCQLIVSSNRLATEAARMKFKVVAQSFDATDKQLVNCVQQLISKSV